MLKAKNVSFGKFGLRKDALKLLLFYEEVLWYIIPCMLCARIYLDALEERQIGCDQASPPESSYKL